MTDHVHQIQSNVPIDELVHGQKPEAKVTPGTRHDVQTPPSSFHDLSGDDFDRNRVHFRKLNQLTGPISVEGAIPGDALGLTIHSIALDEATYVPYIARWLSGTLGISRSDISRYTIVNGRVKLDSNTAIDISPMIGCIATTPAHGSLSSLSPTGPTGGNLDLAQIAPGATVWLPVEVERAMFAIGDLHASMGIGEPMLVGLEATGVVTLTPKVARQTNLTGPRIESEASIAFVGSDPTDIDTAERRAAQSAWNWLVQDLNITQKTAFALSAAMLDVSLGGPAGRNIVASFDLERLRRAGVTPSLLNDVSS